ncbi:MAG: ExeA family protein [Acidobacteriota bacterium]
MYKAFYGLKERPFGKTPDPRFLYLAPRYEEALARLEYAVEEREIAVLTGEIGCGKTTLSRALMDRNERDRFVLVVNPRLTPFQLLRELALRLEVPPGPNRADLLDALSDRLLELHEEGRGAVLVVDEAQLIPGKATFDEIRLLSNFQLDTENLLAILLLGQPELRRRLRHPAYRALRQRVGMWYHLDGLTEEETAAYVAHRLRVAGGDGEVFTPAALSAVHRFTGGVPRLVNNLCTNALLLGFEREERPVTETTVRDAAGEMGP